MSREESKDDWLIAKELDNLSKFLITRSQKVHEYITEIASIRKQRFYYHREELKELDQVLEEL